MTKTFTENDLVRLLYHEVNEDIRLEMLESLRTDASLESTLVDMHEAKSMLENLEMTPSEEIVSRILHVAKNLQSV